MVTCFQNHFCSLCVAKFATMFWQFFHLFRRTWKRFFRWRRWCRWSGFGIRWRRWLTTRWRNGRRHSSPTPTQTETATEPNLVHSRTNWSAWKRWQQLFWYFVLSLEVGILFYLYWKEAKSEREIVSPLFPLSLPSFPSREQIWYTNSSFSPFSSLQVLPVRTALRSQKLKIEAEWSDDMDMDMWMRPDPWSN